MPEGKVKDGVLAAKRNQLRCVALLTTIQQANLFLASVSGLKLSCVFNGVLAARQNYEYFKVATPWTGKPWSKFNVEISGIDPAVSRRSMDLDLEGRVAP